MVDYYELLGISPDATVEEIRSAYDDQYRELSQKAMRHHDQSERLKAEQKRLDLEKAIAVLIDPVKRAEYDTKLGRGQGGGLIDSDEPQPHDQQNSIPFTPPQSPPETEAVRVDAWGCLNCQHPNPIGTRYCQRCGYSVGVDCPNCGKLIDAAAKYCPNCSIELEPALAEKRRKEEERIRQQQQQRLKSLQAQLNELQGQRDELQVLNERMFAPMRWTKGFDVWKKYTFSGCRMWVVFPVLGLGGMGLLMSIIVSVFVIVFGEGTAIMVVGLITAAITGVAYLLFLQLQLAKPMITSDLDNLDSKLKEVRIEIHEIQTSSIS